MFHWSYDALGRLESEAYRGPDAADDYIDRYAFDLVGNRLLKERDENATVAADVPPTVFNADTVITYTYGASRRSKAMEITPYLLYEDVAGAVKFLAKAFGFRKYGTQMRGPDGRINHAAMRLGDDVVMMGCPGPGYRNPKRLGQATQNLYVNVDDVDRHFRRAKRAGATIIEEPADTHYGHRRYGAADPEGHVWYFAREIGRPKSKRNTR